MCNPCKIFYLQQSIYFLSIIYESQKIHVRIEDMHIYVFSLLKCKMHLYNSVNLKYKFIFALAY
jgi:hypothetical protein